ncbi:MAG: isochorismatase family protein [Pedosphaera sp.]|nr:isochorismatase family protein [Pedosphaera sp.]
MKKITSFASLSLLMAGTWLFAADAPRTYENKLTPIKRPKPLLADHPEWVEPIRETNRWEAPAIVNDPGADLHVRAWRWSYNARGIIEAPNHLRARETAIVMVHPWGIDDGQGWTTPEPAGVCDFCTPEKNHLAAKHTRGVIDPFHKSLRGKVGVILYSLPGECDPIRRKMYRSFTRNPDAAERKQGAAELDAKLRGFSYRGEPLVKSLTLSSDKPVVDYFKQFPGLDASDRYNNTNFWKLPIPVTRDITVHPDDVVVYDGEGYEKLRAFLQRQGIRHVLLTGYATDMCYARTCAGYENLSKDFNTFLVGDATLATFPAHVTPKFATSAHIAFASLNQLVTQISWIKYEPKKK